MPDMPSQFAINLEKSESCYSFPKPEPLDPITDSLKESVFFPSIHAYIIVDSKIRKSGDFGVEMNTMYGTRNSGMEVYLNSYTDVKEGLNYLKKLNRVTSDLIGFIERNNLKQREE